MKRILFVCTGNTCRSPVAEVMLKTMLKGAGIKNISVRSAGISSKGGKLMNEKSKIALKQLGYRIPNFKSRRLTPELIENSDMVICLTQEHKDAIQGFRKVYTIKELTGLEDIIDPYGYGLEVYLETAVLIENACKVIFEKIKKSI